MAANAQAATPIRNRRFIFTVSLGAAPSRRGDNARGTREFPFQIESADDFNECLSIATGGFKAQARKSEIRSYVRIWDLPLGGSARLT
jgi:hypothetical protein